MIEPPSLPTILPVLDVQGGDVVWGIAGQRQSYRPLKSPLANGSRPLAVARGLRQCVGHPWLYLADLDAIQRDDPQWDLIGELAGDGFRLVADAGLREASRARALCDAGVEFVIAALETLPNLETLQEIVQAIGGRRTLFSLDLRRGRPLGNLESWTTENPISIGTSAIEAGIHGLIVLDLAGVGVANGVATEDLCRQLRGAHPSVQIVTGGGVRDLGDVQNLLATGIDSVLIASALHRGTISSEEIASLCKRG